MGIKFIKKTNEAFDPGNVVQKYSITAEVTIPDEDGGYETETCRYVPIAPDEEAAKRKFREWFDKRSDYPEGSTYKILKISPVRMYPRKAEAAYTAIKNPEQAAFIIDCGSPEKASALNDAFEAIAEKVWDDDPDARATIGRDIIQYWDVGPYFTACVDPCDKAAKWCEEWLRNSDGKAPGIQGNDAGLESKSIKNENTLTGLLAKNPVWNEIGSGDTAELADNIEKGEWIGLMTGAEDDTDAGWDKYIADTFGPFVDFVEARYIKPDENDPDFRVAQIKFKPLFNRLSTNAKTGLLADLGDKIEDGYFAVMEKRNEELSPKMKQRLKLKSWQAATEKLKGFDEAGHTFLDMIDGEKFPTIFLPVSPKPTKEEGEKVAEKIFGDFEGYLNYGADFDEGEGVEDAWLPYYGLTKEFLDLPEGEGLEVLSELSDVLYRAYTKGECVSEDRRGADRYGHSVRRFTSKDLTDVADDDGDKFGLAYLDTTSISSFSNDFIPSVRDRFLHDLAQMPVSKKSIEDLLRKHKLHKFGDPIGVRDFFPENGIAYLGTYASDGLPYKELVLRWGPDLKK